MYLFDGLNLFTNISGNLKLWDIFRFVFRQLRMTFFHKIMVAKFFFLQMHNTILQRVKFLNLKIINLEKIK